VSAEEAGVMTARSILKNQIKHEEALLRDNLMNQIKDDLLEDELELVNGIDFSKKAEARARLKELKKDRTKSFRNLKQKAQEREQARAKVLCKSEETPIDPLDNYPSWPGNRHCDPEETKTAAQLGDPTTFIKRFVDHHVKYSNTPKSSAASDTPRSCINENELNKTLQASTLGNTTQKIGDSNVGLRPTEPVNRAPLRSLPVDRLQNKADRSTPLPSSSALPPTPNLLPSAKPQVIPVRRDQDQSFGASALKMMLKQSEAEVRTILSRSTTGMLNFYDRLKRATESLPRKAHCFNVLMQVVAESHPFLHKSNSLLSSERLCPIELAEDGILITFGVEKQRDREVELGVKLSSHSSKPLSFWTRKSGEQRRTYF
jgi:hypothetical protein